MSGLNILIVGATGKQGGQAISKLLNRNDPNIHLRFLTRNRSSPTAAKLIAQGAQAVTADLFNQESLVTALDGVDRAFLVTDAFVGEEKEVQQGFNFIDAAKVAGVKHLVFTSVAAADTAKQVPHFRSKGKIEECLRASGMTYTILRPVGFMDNIPRGPGVGRFMILGAFYASIGWKKCELIATEDIGVFAAKALLEPESPDFQNTTINLSAGNYGLTDARAAIERSQGYAPWIASFMPTAIRWLMPYDFKQMVIFLDETGYPKINYDDLRAIHPGLKTLEEYFAQDKK